MGTQYTATEYQQKLTDNEKIFNEIFDPAYAEALARNVTNLIDDVFFRSVFIGFDQPIARNNPERPVILVSNHSGMTYPWDALMFGAGLFRRMGYDFRKTVRPLAAPVLSQTPIMNPYLFNNLWKKIGGIDATYLNFETMMNYPDSNVLIFPEGIPGIGKGWNRRYELQPFATSFVRMSLKYKTDVQPFYCVNGENINPHCYSFDAINKLTRKLGFSFFPIGLLLLILPWQPWLLYYAFPAKLTYVRGQRLRPFEWFDKPYEDVTEEEIKSIRDRIHAAMQKELNQSVAEYGQKPYEWREHFGYVLKNWRKFPFFLPWGWPLLFHEFHRKWEQNKHKDMEIDIKFPSFFRMLLRNPFCIVYFIPIIGFIPIMWRGYRGNTLGKSKAGWGI